MNLKEIRQEKGLNQETLSEKSGVNLRMVRGYEQGEKSINKAQAITVYKLAKTLNCSMEDLIEK